MSFSITPAGWIIIPIILVCALSFGKSRRLNICYLTFASFFVLCGVVGLVVIRPALKLQLKNSTQFVCWAFKKFDTYTYITMPLLVLVIIVLLVLLIFVRRNPENFIFKHYSGIVITIMVASSFFTAWYNLGTINKIFNLGAYTSAVSLAQCFILYIPLIAKRIVDLKAK